MTHPMNQPQVSGYFCYKKLPWNLVKKAAALGGPALCVYIGLWTLYSATRKTQIKLQKDFFDDTGLAGSIISKALKHLICAGLINEIRRERGKTPIVELVIDQKEVYAKY